VKTAQKQRKNSVKWCEHSVKWCEGESPDGVAASLLKLVRYLRFFFQISKTSGHRVRNIAKWKMTPR